MAITIQNTTRRIISKLVNIKNMLGRITSFGNAVKDAFLFACLVKTY